MLVYGDFGLWVKYGILQSSAVLTVEQSDVLHVGIGDVVLDTRILTDRTHRDTVSAIAPEILHVDISCIWLRREAVIANIDTSIRDSQSINIE